MFSNLKNYFHSLISSRIIFFALVFATFAGILVVRLFDLQIINGESYLTNFNLSIKKERSIDSTRGNIYDRDGVVLAYNELAYSVTIKDIIPSGKTKNTTLNDIIKNVITIIESNGDSIDFSFGIEIDENDEYTFTLSGTRLNRFKADIYGRKYISDMTYAESSANPDEIMDYLCSDKRFNLNRENLSKDISLKIIAIRYLISLNAYQKYIETPIAYDVSPITVATIYENSDVLQGVSISEDTIRVYPTGLYTSQIIGYTGIISGEEYDEYSAIDPSYSTSDIVGKIGIEKSMEAELKGIKGSETVYVDTLGRIISSENYKEASSGNNVYLTISSEYQEAIYRIIEQHLAGLILKKLVNEKEYVAKENSSSSDITIPVYDVYYQLINNNILDVYQFSADDATENEKAVYEAFLKKQDEVLTKLHTELTTTKTVYKKLTVEYKYYENYIEDVLINNNVLDSTKIDYNDSTYKAWAVDETISLSAYINYAISKAWINIDKLNINSDYSEASDIFNAIVDFSLKNAKEDLTFDKLLYKYIIKSDKIKPRVLCNCLIDQGKVTIPEDELSKWNNNKITPYDFIRTRISNLDLTPAQLALDPCTASVVITDVNTGDVLALVSYPSYDNNYLANGADASYLRTINQDLSRPMLNYATQQRTAPGSTFKMVTSTAGLLEGIIKTNTLITCLGQFAETNDKHNCWIYPRKHNALNVTGAIKNSCNYFFYTIGYKMSLDSKGKHDSEKGIETLNKYAKLYGLGDKSGIEIEESKPILTSAYAIPSAIGQGTYSFTTVGLARYVTAVANRGTVYNITLIDKITDPNSNLLRENTAEIRNQIDMDRKYWDAIQSGMRQVVESKSYFANFPIEVAGKTGTAQQSKNRADHGLFVCYAPYDKPQIAIACRIANGYSSEYAAETCKDVLMYYFDLKDDDLIVTGNASVTGISSTTGD